MTSEEEAAEEAAAAEEELDHETNHLRQQLPDALRILLLLDVHDTRVKARRELPARHLHHQAADTASFAQHLPLQIARENQI